ncbi:ArsR/SmtB family transcription factor [Halogeometricum borinquense]|uniref:ArsR/SmtB family transcription factor n=1 Tax=Halogeometricum borinquense TaxID=60847 RepID=UPI0034499A8B
MSLLSSLRSEPESSQEGPLRILDVDDDEADAVFDALSSKTTRTILAELHRSPSTPTELADQTDTSIQNAMYHLEKLEETELARVVDTQYSSRGKEMQIYAPSENAAVVFIGTDDRKDGLFSMFKRFLRAIGIIALIGVVLQATTSVLEAVQQIPEEQVASSPNSLVAFAGAITTLVVSYVSNDDSQPPNSRGTSPVLDPMTRKTLLTTIVLLTGVCATPVALAYSPAVSGEYYTSTTPAETTGSEANAGVPDVSDETVHVVVKGGNPDVREALSDQLVTKFNERGATVEQHETIRSVSGSLFVVQLTDNHVEAGGLTPSANFTTYFTYVEYGNATVARTVLSHEQTSDIGPPLFQKNLPGRIAVGSFVFERGSPDLTSALNTIKRGGGDPAVFTSEVGAAAANSSVDQAFDKRLWT